MKESKSLISQNRIKQLENENKKLMEEFEQSKSSHPPQVKSKIIVKFLEKVQ